MLSPSRGQFIGQAFSRLASVLFDNGSRQKLQMHIAINLLCSRSPSRVNFLNLVVQGIDFYSTLFTILAYIFEFVSSKRWILSLSLRVLRAGQPMFLPLFGM
jgi:hypothetical protein